MLPEFKWPMQKKKQVSEPGDADSVWLRRAQHGRERCRRWQQCGLQAGHTSTPTMEDTISILVCFSQMESENKIKLGYWKNTCWTWQICSCSP
jgi:hypothetical protein